MIWEVFRQSAPDDAHEHCGNVHAPDREMAKQFSVIQHGRRKPTRSLWVAPRSESAACTATRTPAPSTVRPTGRCSNRRKRAATTSTAAT
nr:hypothetical protein [Halolamina pelagica]